MKLYYANTPNGMKPLLFLSEFKNKIEADIDLQYVSLLDKEQFKKEFLEVSPNNKIPALKADSLSLFESGVILEYLADEYLNFKNDENRYDILKWLYWQVGGLGPMGGQNHHFQTIKENIPYAIERYIGEVNRLYSVLDGELESNEYIGGDQYHIADMAIYPWIWYYPLHQIDINKYKNVKRWFKQVQQKSSVQAVYKKHMEKLNFND